MKITLGFQLRLAGDKKQVLTKSKLVGGLGFRDLALFNDSLLTKQALRLMHNTNSLFYLILKV